MAKTRGDLLRSDKNVLVGKNQTYALLVDASRNAVLDGSGNEQLADLEVVAGRLQVCASLIGSTGSNRALNTRPDDTTAYTAGDVIGTFTFTDILDTAGQRFCINAISLLIYAAALPSGMTTFRARVYNAAPTALADNAPWVLADADRASYQGYIDITATVEDMGGTLGCQHMSDGVLLEGKGATGSRDLVVQLVTNTAWTPTALTVKDLGLNLV